MFLQNRYTRVYFQIIDRARSEPRQKGQGVYYERHHILPRSAGGSDTKTNLILLTAKEHFICHLLLTKMFEGTYLQSKMKHAFSCMANLCNSKQDRTVSRMYRFHSSPISDQTRKLLSEQRMGSKNPMFGKPEASKHLLIYSQALKGKQRDPITTKRIKENKLLKMCQIMYQHFDKITDTTIKEAKDLGILAVSYPKSVNKIIQGLGYLPDSSV